MKLKTLNSTYLLFFILTFVFHIQIIANETAEKKAIEDLVDKYFSNWSGEDMEGYEECFHPDAIIHFERNGIVKEERLAPFIESQKKAHSFANEKMKEIPVSKKIQFDKNIAQVTVRWKLTSATRELYGYDYFTIVKYRNKWRIIYLIFNND